MRVRAAPLQRNHVGVAVVVGGGGDRAVSLEHAHAARVGLDDPRVVDVGDEIVQRAEVRHVEQQIARFARAVAELERDAPDEMKRHARAHFVVRRRVGHDHVQRDEHPVRVHAVVAAARHAAARAERGDGAAVGRESNALTAHLQRPVIVVAADERGAARRVVHERRTAFAVLARTEARFQIHPTALTPEFVRVEALTVGVRLPFVQQMRMKLAHDRGARSCETGGGRREPPRLHLESRVGAAERVADVRVAAVQVERAVVDFFGPKHGVSGCAV